MELHILENIIRAALIGIYFIVGLLSGSGFLAVIWAISGLLRRKKKPVQVGKARHTEEKEEAVVDPELVKRAGLN